MPLITVNQKQSNRVNCSATCLGRLAYVFGAALWNQKVQTAGRRMPRPHWQLASEHIVRDRCRPTAEGNQLRCTTFNCLVSTATATVASAAAALANVALSTITFDYAILVNSIRPRCRRSRLPARVRISSICHCFEQTNCNK